MLTKALHAFQQRLKHFNEDLELVDVFVRSAERGQLHQEGSPYVLSAIDPARHQALLKRKNKPQSRLLIVRHLRATVYAAYVKDVYEEVTEYLRTILKHAATNPLSVERIIGEHTFKMDAKDVLLLGSWAALCASVSDSIFQSLESERSTLKLLKKMRAKLALDFPDEPIDKAVPYLSIRHYLVHSDGRLPKEFQDTYPEIAHNREGNVELNFAFITQFRVTIWALLIAFDTEVIAKSVVGASHIHGRGRVQAGGEQFAPKPAVA